MMKNRALLPLRTWCDNCLQWLEHDVRYCPLFPEVFGIKKWRKCVCLVHSCDDAKAAGVKRDKKSAPNYQDFVDEDADPFSLFKNRGRPA
jgi:RNA polymerase subunit RPABC4/transcription elongation factor Spt4